MSFIYLFLVFFHFQISSSLVPCPLGCQCPVRMSVAMATEDVHSCVLTHMTVTIAHVAKVSKLTENAGVAQVSL